MTNTKQRIGVNAVTTCPLCCRDLDAHSLDQARQCLAVLQERLGYCYVIGKRDIAPSASWAKWEPPK
jgi:hypothetical protein